MDLGVRTLRRQIDIIGPATADIGLVKCVGGELEHCGLALIAIHALDHRDGVIDRVNHQRVGGYAGIGGRKARMAPVEVDLAHDGEEGAE